MGKKRSFRLPDGRVADVDDNKVAALLEIEPDAKEVKSYIVGKDTVDVPIENTKDFLAIEPEATPLYSDEETKPTQGKTNPYAPQANWNAKTTTPMLPTLPSTPEDATPDSDAEKLKALQAQYDKWIGEKKVVKSHIETLKTNQSDADATTTPQPNIVESLGLKTTAKGSGVVDRLIHGGITPQDQQAEIKDWEKTLNNMTQSVVENTKKQKEVLQKQFAKDIDNNYKDFLGIAPVGEIEVVNPRMVQEYTDKLMAKMGIPQTTERRDFIKNAVTEYVSSYATYKRITPDAEKRFAAIYGKPLAQAAEEDGADTEAAKKITALDSSFVAQSKFLATAIKNEHTADIDQVSKDAQQLGNDLQTQWAAVDNDFKQRAEALTKQSAQMTQEQFNAASTQFQKEYEAARAEKYDDYKMAFEAVLNQERKINNSIKSDYERRQSILESQYVANRNKIVAEHKNKPHSKKFIDAYAKAFDEAFAADAKSKVDKVNKYQEEHGRLAALGNSFVASTAASVRNLANTLGLQNVSDGMELIQSAYQLSPKQVGDRLEGASVNPKQMANIVLDDLFSNVGFATAGQIAGSGVTGMAIAGLSAYTGNVLGVSEGLSMAVGGFIMWGQETNDIQRSIYDEVYTRTGDVQLAQSAADESIKAQLPFLAISGLDMLPFMPDASILKKVIPNNVLRKAAVVVGEQAGQTSQEIAQNAVQNYLTDPEHIYEQKDWAKADDYLTKKLIAQTTLQTLPMMGQTMLMTALSSKYPKSDKTLVKEFMARNKVAERINELGDNFGIQQLTQYYDVLGAPRTLVMLSALQAQGKLTPEKQAQLTTAILNHDNHVVSAEKLGFAGGKKYAYTGLRQALDAIDQDIAKAKDDTEKGIHEQRKKMVNGLIQQLVTTGDADIVLIRNKNGVQFTLTEQEALRFLSEDGMIEQLQAANAEVIAMGATKDKINAVIAQSVEKANEKKNTVEDEDAKRAAETLAQIPQVTEDEDAKRAAAILAEVPQTPADERTTIQEQLDNETDKETRANLGQQLTLLDTRKQHEDKLAQIADEVAELSKDGKAVDNIEKLTALAQDKKKIEKSISDINNQLKTKKDENETKAKGRQEEALLKQKSWHDLEDGDVLVINGEDVEVSSVYRNIGGAVHSIEYKGKDGKAHTATLSGMSIIDDYGIPLHVKNKGEEAQPKSEKAGVESPLPATPKESTSDKTTIEKVRVKDLEVGDVVTIKGKDGTWKVERKTKGGVDLAHTTKQGAFFRDADDGDIDGRVVTLSENAKSPTKPSPSIAEPTSDKKDGGGLSRGDGFKQAGEKAKETGDATHIGRWMLDNSQKGDVVRFGDGGYEVTEVSTRKDGTRELVLTPFEFNEDGSKDYNNTGIKIITEQSIKNGSNLFENAYTNSKGERVIEQSTYEPKDQSLSPNIPKEGGGLSRGDVNEEVNNFREKYPQVKETPIDITQFKEDVDRWAENNKHPQDLQTLNNLSKKEIDKLPPIIIGEYGGKMKIIDGWHRIYSALKQGKTELNALIEPQDPSLSSNQKERGVSEGDTKELINQSNEFEKQHSDAIDRYGRPKNDVEEKQASKDINSIREQRRERDKKLFKDNKTDGKYDDVHDAILSDGEDMPKGYSATVIDSYYEPIMGRYHTIAEVINPKGEKYYIDVNTYKRRSIGETYGEQSIKKTPKAQSLSSNTPSKTVVSENPALKDVESTKIALVNHFKSDISNKKQTREEFIRQHYEGVRADMIKRGNWSGFERERVIENSKKDLASAKNNRPFDHFLLEVVYNNGYIGAQAELNVKAKNIAESYHKAKADGSNPELVKAVEDLLGKSPSIAETTSDKKEGGGLSRGDVGEEMGGEKLPTVDEVYDILESEESRQGGSWLDNEYGDARFENESQARKYAEEVHSFLVGLGEEKEIPVYRAVAAKDVDLSPYGIGESWSFSLDAAKEFGKRLGVPLSEVKIISGKVPSENVDWQQAVRQYHNFSDIHSGESEFELPIPANRKIKDIKVDNFKDAKDQSLSSNTPSTEETTSDKKDGGGLGRGDADSFKEGGTAYLYHFQNGEMKEVEVELMKDRYVKPKVKDGEPTPIEDYGDYILNDKKLSKEEAFNEFIKRQDADLSPNIEPTGRGGEASDVGGKKTEVDIKKPKVGKYDGDTDFEIRTPEQLNVDDVLKRDKPIKLYPEQIVPIDNQYSEKESNWIADRDIVINEGYGSIKIKKGDKLFIRVDSPANGDANSSNSYKVYIKGRSYPLSHFIPETAEHGSLDEAKHFDAITQMKNFDKVLSGEIETPQQSREHRIKIAETLIPDNDFYVAKPYNSKSGFESPQKVIFKDGKWLRLRNDEWDNSKDYEYNVWGEYANKNELAWDIVNNARVILKNKKATDLQEQWNKQYDYLTSENKKRVSISPSTVEPTEKVWQQQAQKAFEGQGVETTEVKWWLEKGADVDKMTDAQFEERVLSNNLDDFDRKLRKSYKNRIKAAENKGKYDNEDWGMFANTVEKRKVTESLPTYIDGYYEVTISDGTKKLVKARTRTIAEQKVWDEKGFRISGKYIVSTSKAKYENYPSLAKAKQKSIQKDAELKAQKAFEGQGEQPQFDSTPAKPADTAMAAKAAVKKAWDDMKSQGIIYNPQEDIRKQAALYKALLALARAAIKQAQVTLKEFIARVRNKPEYSTLSDDHLATVYAHALLPPLPPLKYNSLSQDIKDRIIAHAEELITTRGFDDFDAFALKMEEIYGMTEEDARAIYNDIGNTFKDIDIFDIELRNIGQIREHFNNKVMSQVTEGEIADATYMSNTFDEMMQDIDAVFAKVRTANPRGWEGIIFRAIMKHLDDKSLHAAVLADRFVTYINNYLANHDADPNFTLKAKEYKKYRRALMVERQKFTQEFATYFAALQLLKRNSPMTLLVQQGLLSAKKATRAKEIDDAVKGVSQNNGKPNPPAKPKAPAPAAKPKKAAAETVRKNILKELKNAVNHASELAIKIKNIPC